MQNEKNDLRSLIAPARREASSQTRGEITLSSVNIRAALYWMLFAALLLAGTVALRVPVMERSVIDWDESVYLIVASGLLEGRLPYVDVWDHKQLFLYPVFATSFLKADPIVGMRILGCAAVAVTALLLAMIIHRTSRDRFASALAGVLYVLGAMFSGGLATNAEIIFTPFVAAAFLVLVFDPVAERTPARSMYGRLALAGLLCGLAMQIKLIAVFDALAVAVVSTMMCWPKLLPWSRSINLTIRRLIIYGVWLSLPLVMGATVYWLLGHFEEYLFANWRFPITYSDGEVEIFQLAKGAIRRQLGHGNVLLWISGALALPATLLMTRGDRRRFCAASASGIWLVAALVGVCATKKFYDHYFLQPLPAVVLVTCFFVAAALRRRQTVLTAAVGIIVLSIVVVQASGIEREVERILVQPDYPRAVGHYLAEKIEPGEVIYVANGQPVIYLLSGGRPPSKYISPAWVVLPEIRSALGLHLDGFLDEVFRRRPAFVVVDLDHPWMPDDEFLRILENNYLKGHYCPESRFGTTLVLRRIED